MNAELLKKTGNIDQLAGVRESVLLRGRGEGLKLAEFYNAAGLRFSVAEDRCMDLYDLSWKGVNLSFHSQNGITRKLPAGADDKEFSEHWPGGMLVTCGLDNINGASEESGVNYPTHGRISGVPAEHFSAGLFPDNGSFVLRAEGEIRQCRMYGGTFLLQRRIETELYGNSVRIRDVITNCSDRDRPLFLLYHVNFGYPLLDKGAAVFVRGKSAPLDEASVDHRSVTEPEVASSVQKFIWTHLKDGGLAVLHNQKLALAAVLRFRSDVLPNMVEWKHLKANEYVLALEPTSTTVGKRKELLSRKKVPVIPAYGSRETALEIEVMEGNEKIQSFLRKNFPTA